MTASSDPQVRWKTFLESTPAYSSVAISMLVVKKVTRHSLYFHLPHIRIQLHCGVDGGLRWFDCSNGEVTVSDSWEYKFITYVCRDCGRQTKTYAVVIKRTAADALDADVMKLGEFPPFSAAISKRIEKLLGKTDLEMYRKGTRSEAQGLGVGAATYFRRIVESQWKVLVTEIRDAARTLGVEDLSVFDAAVRETQFSKAVEMLKGAIPPKLLILNGENPLTLPYQPLSQGLHELTDAECLQQAADIRIVLTALLENIAEVLKDQNELKSAAARLRERRAQST
jgi:hypothetical protein